jgi:hypothetical protein
LPQRKKILKKERIKMAITANNTKVVTGEVRLSYAHIWKPVAISEGQEPKYSVCLLIPKSDKKTLRKIKAAVDAAKESGKSIWDGKIPANLKMPLRDGDVDRSDQPEYEGMYFINANSKMAPGIVDQNVQPILDSTEVYSGCYARASINFFPYNHAGNRGIGCGLNNIQKLRDGDYLGGRSKPEDDFDAVEAEDEDDMEDFLG